MYYTKIPTSIQKRKLNLENHTHRAIYTNKGPVGTHVSLVHMMLSRTNALSNGTPQHSSTLPSRPSTSYNTYIRCDALLESSYPSAHIMHTVCAYYATHSLKPRTHTICQITSSRATYIDAHCEPRRHMAEMTSSYCKKGQLVLTKTV